MKAILTYKNERVNIRLVRAFDEASAKKEVRETVKKRPHLKKNYKLEVKGIE